VIAAMPEILGDIITLIRPVEQEEQLQKLAGVDGLRLSIL